MGRKPRQKKGVSKMGLYGGKIGGTTHIDPRETGTAPSPEQARALLKSLGSTGTAHKDGAFLSTDGLIGASPATGYGAEATEGHQTIVEQRIVAVDWSPDGTEEWHWEFPVEHWKGRQQLVSRVRAKLCEITA